MPKTALKNFFLTSEGKPGIFRSILKTLICSYFPYRYKTYKLCLASKHHQQCFDLVCASSTQTSYTATWTAMSTRVSLEPVSLGLQTLSEVPNEWIVPTQSQSAIESVQRHILVPGLLTKSVLASC